MAVQLLKAKQMVQQIDYIANGEIRSVELPNQRVEVLPGLKWGRPAEPFTPAFWVAQAAFHQATSDPDVSTTFRLATSIREEAAACLLGGHGIPAEVGLAAFAAIRSAGLLIEQTPSEADIYEALTQPLHVKGRNIKYRFARQKSKYLAALLKMFSQYPTGLTDLQLREWLLQCPGIGLKTASWIVRNWRGSDLVAIIDIHIHRAGILAGIFSMNDTLPRHYLDMERRFLDFASAIGIRPSLLDAVVWQQMRRSATLALTMLNEFAGTWRSRTAA